MKIQEKIAKFLDNTFSCKPPASFFSAILKSFGLILSKLTSGTIRVGVGVTGKSLMHVSTDLAPLLRGSS